MQRKARAHSYWFSGVFAYLQALKGETVDIDFA